MRKVGRAWLRDSSALCSVICGCLEVAETVWNRGQQTFLLKDQIINILDFVRHSGSTTAQPHCCDMKVATDTMLTNDCGCSLTDFY